MADGGYTGETFANTVKALSGAEVEIVKRNELHTFAVLPTRWIVERSFAWLDKCWRLWKNCERKLQNSFQMFSLAFIRLLLNRFSISSMISILYLARTLSLSGRRFSKRAFLSCSMSWLQLM